MFFLSPTSAPIEGRRREGGIEMGNEYHVKIYDDKIKLYHEKNDWRWYRIYVIHRHGATEYNYDIDNGLVIRFYKARHEKCFEIMKNKSIGMLEKPVYFIDEELLEEIFKACYELEHVSY
jgi:hypothetical protein